jgi:hypothetical protein
MAQGNCRDTGRGEKLASIHRGKNITSTLRADMLNLFIAFFTLHPLPNPIRSLCLGQHPIPDGPRWIMPHMQPVAALQLRGPLALFILIKAHHGPLHRPQSLHIE